MQELPGGTRNFRPEVPGRTKKSENGYLTRYQEDENSPNRVPNREAFFLVGSWLRPEDFGFGHPLEDTSLGTWLAGIKVNRKHDSRYITTLTN